MIISKKFFEDVFITLPQKLNFEHYTVEFEYSKYTNEVPVTASVVQVREKRHSNNCFSVLKILGSS